MSETGGDIGDVRTNGCAVDSSHILQNLIPKKGEKERQGHKEGNSGGKYGRDSWR